MAQGGLSHVLEADLPSPWTDWAKADAEGGAGVDLPYGGGEPHLGSSPILKKLALEQGGPNIFRRFRITATETAEVPQALQHTWSGHARTHVPEVYKKLLKQREWRLGWAERAGMGF